jgi:uncharacterized repeat protein (TIGR01451 family)
MQTYFSSLSMSAKRMLTFFAVFVVTILFLVSSAIGIFLISNDGNLRALADISRPTEPTNCTPTPSPAFNGYRTNMNNPNVDSTTCQDIPVLSFKEVALGNPRTLPLPIQGPTSFQLTYINSAGIGNPANDIINPNAKVSVIDLGNNQYRMSASLTSSNTAEYSSSNEGNLGGDLTFSIPAGYKLKYIQNSAKHYDTNLDRAWNAEYGDGQSPFDFISDNGRNSNPIFSRFDGTTLSANSGYNLRTRAGQNNRLPAGFINSGYILFSLDIEPVITNLPPVLTGEEITIIRGQQGSFKPLNPTDPDNDLPISLAVANALNYCTPATVASGSIITCTATPTAPKRATFTITPTDSRNLTGLPATFIVNILDPGLDVVKSCVKKGTTTPCSDAQLKPGETVTYRLNLTNTGETNLTNVVMVDDYDQTKLTNITNINPPVSNHDTANGVLTWNIGTLAKNGSVLGTFDATVQNSITANTTILNRVSASADGVPTKTSEVIFPVIVPNTPPQIPGEEITIIRGQEGSFKPLNPTDPENNTPISLNITNALSFCLPNTNNTLQAGTVINCKTDANTPARSTFTITPTDSKGLVGTPGTFIVNVIDPGLNLTKDCFTLGANPVRCESANLYAGDTVKYVLTVSNTGQTNLTNVVVTDNYDETKVETPTGISPVQSSLDTNNGIVVWNLGNFAKGEAPKKIEYNVKIKENIVQSTTVKNIATAKSNETPEKKAEREFPVQRNLPPQIPGEEIIIERGKEGSFKPLNPTDPENNTPISLAITNALSWCTPNTNNTLQAGTVINCKTDANTPSVSTFTITPTDSKGLVGTPGTFVVRIIDPSLNIIKKCTIKSTNKLCDKQSVGDVVTYTLTVINNGEFDLTEVVVTDDYDQSLLSNISNINPTGTNSDGKIVWQVPRLSKGQSREFSFDATVTESALDKVVLNIALAKSKETPEKSDENRFNVLGNPVLEIVKSCIALKNNKACKDAELTTGDKIKYIVTVKNSGKSTAREVKVVDNYDETKIENISNINPNGLHDKTNGIITWELGNLNAGGSLEVNFTASIMSGLTNATLIDNIATVSAKDLPPVSTNYRFPIIVNPPVIRRLGTTGGIAILASWGLLITTGSIYLYFHNAKKTNKGFVPARSREEK